MLIKISREDVARSVKFGSLIPEGYSKFRIMEFEQKAAKGGDSVNWIYKFKRVEELDDELEPELIQYFNSKAISTLVPFIAALVNKTQKEVLNEMSGADLEFDPSACIGKDLYIKVKHEIWEGKPRNSVADFSSLENVPF
jgi:hypothetical protein